MIVYSILICNTDKEMATFYTSTFSQFKNFKITTIENNQNAISKAEENCYDYIIFDSDSPASSIQLATQIRTLPPHQDTPILVISGAEDKVQTKIANNLGIVLLVKPISEKFLLEKLITALNFKKEGMKYNADMVNLIIDSIIKVFEHYLNDKIHVGKPSTKPGDAPPRGNITSVISLAGNGFSGSLALSANTSFIKKLSAGFFPDNEIKLDKDLTHDIVAETSNQVIGRVKSKLLEYGQNTTIGLPNIITGRDHKHYHTANGPILFLPVGKSNMGCDVEFCFTTTKIELNQNSSKDEDKSAGDVILFD